MAWRERLTRAQLQSKLNDLSLLIIKAKRQQASNDLKDYEKQRRKYQELLRAAPKSERFASRTETEVKDLKRRVDREIIERKARLKTEKNTSEHAKQNREIREFIGLQNELKQELAYRERLQKVQLTTR